MKEITEQEALSKAAAYCSSAEHCTAEVVAKLDAWGIPTEGQARILARLVQEHYIDEARYARLTRSFASTNGDATRLSKD